ncbi:immunity protein Tsi6 family protein [Phenylobacterium sp.]|uniref:immunity protein Tsi6 family protein n=1 Tax=Phenylobacterium sp. TaxID=1871053 RepID=UPI0035205E3A
MTRRGLFEDALASARELLERYPFSVPLKSAVEQIEYLVDLESGKEVDRSKLPRINLGVIAAREVEDMDSGVAGKIYRVTSEIEKMMRNQSGDTHDFHNSVPAGSATAPRLGRPIAPNQTGDTHHFCKIVRVPTYRGQPLPKDPGAYVVPMGRAVGQGGETSIKIIVRPGTTEVITAYPVR